MGVNLDLKDFNNQLNLKDKKKLSKFLFRINFLEWPKFLKVLKKL